MADEVVDGRLRVESLDGSLLSSDQVNDMILDSVARHDLSIWGLFTQADIVVKAAVVILILASIWSWSVALDKFFLLRRLRRKADQFEEVFWSSDSLLDLYDRVGKRASDPVSNIFVIAMGEWVRSSSRGGEGLRHEGGRVGLQSRIERMMDISLNKDIEKVESNVGFLASVASSAPFVGLFGTVWGIMNAFTSIAATNNTSLAVVAPGIAEALFATALGLVAAIPAVLAYNKLSSAVGGYAARLESFAGELGAILSRQLEED